MTNLPDKARQLAQCIDHTLLKAEAGQAAIKKLCREAIDYGFAAVCVQPCHVSLAAELLAGRPSKVCSVAGFPLGANHSKIKAAEAAQAIADGAREIDMVINPAAALEEDAAYLKADIAAVLEPCRAAGQPTVLKVIFETAALPEHTKILLCRLADELGVDYIKTSTGLHPAGGATIEDVQLLYRHRGRCKVKAAGGISDLARLRAMLNAGAERIGTSSAVAIMESLLRECSPGGSGLNI